MKVIGNLQILGQKSIIKMNPIPSSHHEYSGWISEEYMGQDVDPGDVLYFDAIMEHWNKAQANSINTMPARAIALETISAGATGKILRYGTYRIGDAESHLENYNFNGPYIYVSADTAGKMTKTKPAASGNIIQKIGTPLRQDVGWFDFNTTITMIDPGTMTETLVI